MIDLKIGMSMAQVRAVLGHPTNVLEGPRTVKWYYSGSDSSFSSAELTFSPHDGGSLNGWTEYGKSQKHWGDAEWSKIALGDSTQKVLGVLGEPSQRDVGLGAREHWTFKDGVYERAVLIFVSDKLDTARRSQ